MKTSIVIATFNKFEYTEQCIASIREYTPAGSYEIIVVDNHSTDNTVEWLKAQSDIISIVNEENLGFPIACNQGIEVASGDNILLLNNDTIVAPRWLENMLVCLYSDDSIGAVGPVTNSCSNLQQIEVPYDSIESMVEFAEQYNCSDPTKWEERIRLIGFCMLIKKQAINKIGLLDERFTPGNLEDDDYSHRLRVAGYRLILCKDTFIHHFGSMSFKENVQNYIDLIMRNRKKFCDKWGYDPYIACTKWDALVELIDYEHDKEIRVLELGCHYGETLLSVKKRFPNAQLFGIEPNQYEANIASAFASVQVGPLNSLRGMYEEHSFDVILMGENFEKYMDESTLRTVKGYLREEGQFLAYVPNIMHHQIIQSFFTGEINREKLAGFHYSEISAHFERCGFGQVHYQLVRSSPMSQEDSLFEVCQAYCSTTPISLFESSHFLVHARVETAEDELRRAIEGLVNSESPIYNLSKIRKQDVNNVISFIQSHYSEPSMLLNFVAIQFLESKEDENVMSLLNRAYELDPTNTTTIFNLGMTMYTLGHNELALDWWSQIPDKDEKLIRWIADIEDEMNKERKIDRELGFLLRRLDFCIDEEEAVAELSKKLEDEQILIERILERIEIDVMNKTGVLNMLAAQLFNQGYLDNALIIFDRVLSMNPQDVDSLFNISYILYLQGKIEQSFSLIKKIENPGEHINQLRDLILEEINYE